MDCSEPSPRVNCELMGRFVGKKVRLVGKVEGMENGMARLVASDGGVVMVRSKAGSSYDSSFVEVEGIVQSPNTIDEMDMSSFGDSFDMANYNEACKLANSDKGALFYN
mmetsp:Transcript_20330/g.64666  ORF Transcript_20330/g.64666 Transcript_20330/m.64666 type:complete len:109 (-) Transcript_20330:241-567(-)